MLNNGNWIESKNFELMHPEAWGNIVCLGNISKECESSLQRVRDDFTKRWSRPFFPLSVSLSLLVLCAMLSLCSLLRFFLLSKLSGGVTAVTRTCTVVLELSPSRALSGRRSGTIAGDGEAGSSMSTIESSSVWLTERSAVSNERSSSPKSSPLPAASS